VHNSRIGVVGPGDLVSEVARIVERQPRMQPIEFVYAHESDAPRIARAHEAEVDGWLFTGVIPYTLATTTGAALRAPAHYVTNGRLALLSALVRLARERQGDVGHLSIDTISEAEVRASLEGTGIPAESISIRPYTAGTSSADFAAFHRRESERSPGSVALTCVRSVFDELDGELSVVRLHPAPADVEQSAAMLTMAIDTERNRDQGAVVGFLVLSKDDDLAADLAPLSGEVISTGPGRYVLLTTRGPFEDATAGLTSVEFLGALAERHDELRAGFGLAGSVAEASARASRALTRASTLASKCVVVTTRGGDDLVLEFGAGTPVAPSLAALHARTGIATQTLIDIRELSRAHGSILTADILAASAGLVERSARRILTRLERGGGAVGRPAPSAGAVGRPRREYEIRY
jgi:hypothetical protein